VSRAFVKEPEGDQAESNLPERPQSDHSNYMTQTGLDKMQSTINALRQERSLLKKEDDLSAKTRVKVIEAELRYLEKRIQCAIPVDISKQISKEIRFGATVKLIDENDQEYIFRPRVRMKPNLIKDVSVGSRHWRENLSARKLTML